MIHMSLVAIAWNLALAARWTVALSLVAFAGGILAALLLLPLRLSKIAAAKNTVRLYVELFQGSPLLIQLFVIFFGLPLLGVRPSPWTAAAVGMTLWSAAFFVEIWRGSADAVACGQWEASAALGMGYLQQLRYVILPQAFPLSVAPTVGFLVQIVKGTALTSIIGFIDLSRAGTIISNTVFEPFAVYGLVAGIYFALCWPLSIGSRFLERKLRGSHLHH